MEILSIIVLVFVAVIVLMLFCYAFTGVFAFPFYLIGLVFKFFLFPIQLISQIIYPVGNLPRLILSGGVLFFVVYLALMLAKKIISLKK